MAVQRVVQAFEVGADRVHGVGREQLAGVVGDHTVHRLGQRGGGLAHAHEGLFAAWHMRDLQRQRHFAQRALLGVFGHGGLGIEGQAQDRRLTGHAAGQHHAARQHTGHETETGGVLRHIARAPGGAARAQGEAELGIVAAGECVQFAGAGHLASHVGEVGHGAHRVGKGLGLDHELGELDVVERTGAVGQLHPDLQRPVALPGARAFPLATVFDQRLDGKGLAAHTARARQRGEQGLARHLAFELHRRDHVDQRVQPGLLFGCGHHVVERHGHRGDGAHLIAHRHSRHRRIVEHRVDALGAL